MGAEENEPFVAWDRTYGSDQHRSEAADGFVRSRGEHVGGEGLGKCVPKVVDYEGGLQLGRQGRAGLHATVGTEGAHEGIDPGP